MNKLICVFISLIFVLSLNVGASFTEVSEITFENSNGITDALNPSERVTASVKLNNLSDGDSFVFMLTLENGSKIIDSDVMFLTADNSEETLSASLTMPSAVSGLRLNAMLWNGISDMTPLTSSALLPGGENGIKYLMADDELVEGFDNETSGYTKIINTAKKDAPYVSAPAFDGKTSVDIKTTERFPGKSEIKVKNSDNSEYFYEIYYEIDETELVNISSEEYGKIHHNLSEGAKPYQNKENVFIANIPEKLKGSSYISAGENFSEQTSSFNSLWTGEDTDWYLLNLKRTAKIIVFSENEITKFEDSQSGWTEEELSVDLVNSESGEYKSLQNSYSLKIITEEETECQIPNPSCDCGEFFIVVAYEYANVYNGILAEEEKITALKYKGPVSNSENGDTYFDHPSLMEDFSEGAKLFKDNNELVASVINPELIGCDYIITNRMKGSSNSIIDKFHGGSATIDWYSFNLKESATVMIFPDNSYGNALMNAVTDFEKTELEGESYFSLYNKTWSNIHSERNVMYSKYIEVPEGESVTVNIPNAPGRRNDVWAHIVLVDYRVNPLHQETANRGKITNLKYAGPSVEGATYNVLLNSSLSEGKQVYVNTDSIHFKNIHSSIVGKPYITTDNVTNAAYNSTIAGYWFGGARDWVSFDINKSASIKVITDGDTLKHCGAYGFTKADELKYFDAYNTPWNTNLISYNVMYYKDITVPENETVTVIIPNAPTWTTQTTSKRAHVIIVDFAE